MNKKNDFDVIIIGAGASGLFCAAQAIKNGKNVAILEHNSQALKKVAVSGGGRCNFTNLSASFEHYASNNNKFAISALKQFSPNDFLELIKENKIRYTPKAQGQLFCQNGSQDIINLLLKETKQAQFYLNTQPTKIQKQDDIFIIHTPQQIFHTKSLVIASGGASYPNLGASEIGFQIAKQFGHKIIPCKPALVPLTLDNELMKKTFPLKGIAVDSIVKCGEYSIRDNILFTHFGLSGPAILQASLYWNKGDTIKINLLPDIDAAKHLKSLKNNSKGKKISSLLKSFFPEKIVAFLLEDKDIFIAEAPDKLLSELGEKINIWEVVPIGTQGFRMAEATKGGVDVNEISPQTFESKKIHGLFFIGEVLDITGLVGGFNLQWAWSSGFVAGNNV